MLGNIFSKGIKMFREEIQMLPNVVRCVETNVRPLFARSTTTFAKNIILQLYVDLDNHLAEFSQFARIRQYVFLAMFATRC